MRINLIPTNGIFETGFNMPSSGIEIIYTNGDTFTMTANKSEGIILHLTESHS